MGPFTIQDAERVGITRWQLRGSSWRRLGPSTYVWAGLPELPAFRLEGARRRLPHDAAFSGRTAAWLHGLDVEPCDPIEVTVPKKAGVSARSELALHRASLPPDEVVLVAGMRATSVLRTLEDLSAQLTLTEAVVIADMALHAGLATRPALVAWVSERHRPGVVRLREVAELAEPATESPMESRLRMLLHIGGLPRPSVQVPLYEGDRYLGRPDLYYPTARLGIEYDGATHRSNLAADNRRQNGLVNAGIRLLRFTSGDLKTPDTVVEAVRRALAA